MVELVETKVVEHRPVVKSVETEMVRLGDVASIDRRSIAPENIADGTTYVGLENIVSGGEFLRVGPVENGELASQKFVFNADHILYGKLRPYLAKIAMPDFAGICSTDILPVRVGDSMDKRFLAYFLRQAWVVDQVNGLASGASLPRISPKALESIEVPVFPMSYQRRIAAILDKADHLRTQRREALAHLDALTQSIFSDMFGDLNPTTTKWPVLPVGNVCTVIVDCVNKTAPLADSQTPYKMIRTSNVRGRSIDLTSVRFVDENTFVKWNSRAIPSQGDVVLTREAPMGEAGIIPPGEKVFLGQRTMLYRSNPALLTAEYLLYFLTSEYMQREYTKNGSGSTVKHLSVPYCRTLEVATPPVELQQIFARRVAGVELLKEQHRAQLAELDTLFASLQHRAFSGQL